MLINAKTIYRKTFTDKQGKLAVAQVPNLPLIGWIICKVIAFPLHDGSIKTVLNMLSTLLLFGWAALELYSGVNYFRRILGAVVIAVILYGLLR